MKIFSRDYLFEQICEFREVLGLKTYTLEQWENALKGVAYVYLNLEELDEKSGGSARRAFLTITNEYVMRVAYRLGGH